MNIRITALLLGLATGLALAADEPADSGDARSSQPAAAPQKPHRLMWDVQIGVAPPQSKSFIVLLPEASGKPSAVIVKAPQGEVVLDKPYASADVGGAGTIEVGELSADEVRKRFGATLAAQPLRPVSWRLNFSSGSNQLAGDAKAVLGKLKTDLKAELARRATAEILVIGHTDSIGTTAANDALALKRAQFVAAALLKMGIDKAQLDVSGRGAREPQVVAGGRRAEPRNRRVEVVVR